MPFLLPNQRCKSRRLQEEEKRLDKKTPMLLFSVSVVMCVRDWYAGGE